MHALHESTNLKISCNLAKSKSNYPVILIFKAKPFWIKPLKFSYIVYLDQK